ncbi:hypothetical protein KY289_030412 [Solanum tuberosum]|nr:hypothetical protein KY289_030412 [Solanum tuberosum]
MFRKATLVSSMELWGTHQIYATEAASRLGKLMMDALISMHMELRRSYGPEESGCPQWIRWDKLELLPRALKDIVLGSEDLGGWLSYGNYPQLPHKFMFDKAKIHYLLEIIVHMNLERDSLKRQHQNFTSTVLLKKKAFLKHGVKEALRSCVKALNFCATVSCGELQDFALNKFKGIEDELVIKLKSALKEVDGDDEYSLLFLT